MKEPALLLLVFDHTLVVLHVPWELDLASPLLNLGNHSLEVVLKCVRPVELHP